MNPKKVQPSLKPPSFNLYRKIALSFVILTGVLLFLIVYLSFGKAKIVITPAKQPVSVDFIADLQEAKEGRQAVVPGKVSILGKLGEFTIDESKEFEATGSKIVKTDVGGKVTIINNYVKSQTLVATTRLLSPEGILFRTKERIVVPAGGKVEVEVYADPPTEAAAKVGPTHFTIPGLWPALQDKIYGESYGPMHGGEVEVKVLTQSDLERAYDELVKIISQKVVDNLKSEIKESGEVIGRMIIKEIISKTSSANVGDQVSKFTANLKVKAVGVIFLRRDLENLAASQLAKEVSVGKELAEVDYNTLTFIIEKYDLEGHEANIRVHLEGTAVLKPDSPILNKNNLIGRSKEEVISYLTSFPEIKKVEISFSPFWVRKIPRLKDHVEIVIKR
jgi:hypothetical protein